MARSQQYHKHKTRVTARMIPGPLRFSKHSASVGSLWFLLSQNERVKHIILYPFFFFHLRFSFFFKRRVSLEVSQGLNLSPRLITFGVFPSFLQQFCLSTPGTGVALQIHQ